MLESRPQLLGKHDNLQVFAPSLQAPLESQPATRSCARPPPRTGPVAGHVGPSGHLAALAGLSLAALAGFVKQFLCILKIQQLLCCLPQKGNSLVFCFMMQNGGDARARARASRVASPTRLLLDYSKPADSIVFQANMDKFEANGHIPVVTSAYRVGKQK